ncbi:hypothetical protein EZS27_014765 [termite gut metagenome]|uniref:Uncharacterized protein n=1 Tax=termite gut metagenome TaxID=433724 RepID=A0A5J4RVG0_9ZZZZ
MPTLCLSCLTPALLLWRGVGGEAAMLVYSLVSLIIGVAFGAVGEEEFYFLYGG